IKRVILFVHLEFDVVLVIGNSSLEFMHVDGRNTCSDQEGLIKCYNSQSLDDVLVEQEHHQGLAVVLL
ncbi:hypothetical protein Tco_1463368, partial [Tanacetum coccineum]